MLFFVKKAKIDPDGTYHTWLNQTFDSILAFYNTLLSINIKLAFNLNWLLFSQEKRILYLYYLALTIANNLCI